MDSMLRRGALDLVLLPIELASELEGLSRKSLFRDRFVLAADRDNHQLAGIRSMDDDQEDPGPEKLGLILLQRLPIVAVAGDMPSLVDVRLAEQGVELRVDVTTEAFVIAPMLLRGTPLVALVQERLARQVADQAHLRLFESPVNIGGIVETIYWSPWSTHDPAHRWLRSQLIARAQQV